MSVFIPRLGMFSDISFTSKLSAPLSLSLLLWELNNANVGVLNVVLEIS